MSEIKMTNEEALDLSRTIYDDMAERDAMVESLRANLVGALNRIDALEVEQEKHCHLLSKVFPERTEDDIWCKDPERPKTRISFNEPGFDELEATQLNKETVRPAKVYRHQTEDDEEWKAVYREALIKASPERKGGEITYINAPLVIAAKLLVEERTRAETEARKRIETRKRYRNEAEILEHKLHGMTLQWEKACRERDHQQKRADGWMAAFSRADEERASLEKKAVGK